MKDSRAAVARFYDLDRDPLPDLPFYVSQLAGNNTRVLELGCGTGRITIPLAQRCGYIRGIELSEAMLAICRQKLQESPAVAGKVVLTLGDITNYDLATTFDLIIAPYRVLQNLAANQEVAGLFRCVRTHLAEGGSCILNVFNPRYLNREELIEKWSQDVEELDWEALTEGRVVQCHVRRGKLSAEPLVIYPDLTFRVYENGKLIEEVEFPLTMRCYFPQDFADVVVENGFEIIERWGGYAGEQYGIGDELVIQCRPSV